MPTPADALDWFRSAPFGIFIHYGPSSLLAAPTDQEWIAAVRSKRAQELTESFDPNPEIVARWTAFAVAEQASYVTVTTKHHDGFALWPTRTSSWHVERDLVAALVAAAREAGLRIFFYFSTIDWHEPSCPIEEQLTELLTWYGTIDGVWLDGYWSGELTPARMRSIYALVHELQPWALVGDNTHRPPLPGQDFQIFEGGFPGDETAIFDRGVEVELPAQAAVKLGATWFWGGSFDASRSLHRVLRAESQRRRIALLANVAPAPDGTIDFGSGE
jgi:alpha-L-fucosidase